MSGFFGKMKLAQEAFDLYEHLKNNDNDENGKADLLEDFEDLKALHAAVLEHDSATVMERAEAIIRRSGPDIAALTRRFAAQ